MIVTETEWDSLKAMADERQTDLQHVESFSAYEIFSFDGSMACTTKIIKTTPKSADQIDFETNYKSSSNKRNRKVIPEHKNGNVATAGTPATIVATNNEHIGKALVSNPDAGPNKNNINDVLLVSMDNGANFMALSRGDAFMFPGIFANIKIDSNTDGVKYEIILWR